MLKIKYNIIIYIDKVKAKQRRVNMSFDELYKRALEVVNPREFSYYCTGGEVGAAIQSESGNIYTGVCINSACGVGFCAEHSAAAAMITNGENVINKVIAINKKGDILPPCGRCREFLGQLSDLNADAEVMVEEGKVLTLAELLPYDWRKIKNK